MPASAGAGKVAQARKVPASVVPPSLVPTWAATSSVRSLQAQHTRISAEQAWVGRWAPAECPGGGRALRDRAWEARAGGRERLAGSRRQARPGADLPGMRRGSAVLVTVVLHEGLAATALAHIEDVVVTSMPARAHQR